MGRISMGFKLGALAAGLVIFDCDGVLVDSESLALKVDARVLADIGVVDVLASQIFG
jgi:beta-phosphoglucomutase-like phosphatase (HAD superfamily)